MDDRATLIIDMLAELHGAVAALGHESREAAERLDLAEPDIKALLPVVASLAARIERLEARLDARA